MSRPIETKTSKELLSTIFAPSEMLVDGLKEEGLVQDRLWVFETADDDTAKAIIAVMKNRNHRSTEALFSSMRMPYIEDEITHCVDCVAVIRHSCALCSTHNRDKIVNYLYELIQNGYADDDFRRLLPVLLIDNAGTIPEEFQIHQLSVSDRINVDMRITTATAFMTCRQDLTVMLKSASSKRNLLDY